MFPCDYAHCAYVGKRASYLAAHKREHIGQASNKCPHESCTACFTNAPALRLHLLSGHSIVKSFVCGTTGCFYRTTNNVLLKEHKKRHEEIRPYLCQVAGCTWEGANSRRALVKHGLSRHNSVPPPKERNRMRD